MGAGLSEDLPASWALCFAWRSVKGVCSEEQGWQDPWNSLESQPGPCQFPQRQWRQSARMPSQHQGWGHPVHFTPSPPRAGGAGAGTPACFLVLSRFLEVPGLSLVFLPEREIIAAGPGCGPDLQAGGFPPSLLLPPGAEERQRSELQASADGRSQGGLGVWRKGYRLRAGLQEPRPRPWPSPSSADPREAPASCDERRVSRNRGTVRPAGVDPASASTSG